jgi:signal transduction histidine kinase
MQADPTKTMQISDIQQELLIEELRENDFRNQQLVQNLAAAIYTCDIDGYIRFYNKAAVELWGRVPELDKDLWCGSWKIFRPDGSPMSFDECPMAKTLKFQRPVRGEEIIIELPDGTRRNIAPHPDPLFDSAGNCIGAVNLLVDITALKKKENALHESEKKYKKAAEELEIRVNERTKDLAEANTSLQRINQELEQFAFIASHDLQEPLRKINYFTQRLAKGNKESLDETGKELLEKIKNAADGMSILINDILDYSRVRSLDNRFVPTDLNTVLQHVLGDFELILEEKQAVVSSEKLPVVRAIPLQMNQLFNNLISNSLKFCKENPSCILTISSQPVSAEAARLHMLNPDYSYCKIIFKDNGIGFPQEYAEHIFKIFERLNSRDKYQGTGIGLALCRKIVSIHQGEIFARSSTNEGTSFHVILPLAS